MKQLHTLFLILLTLSCTGQGVTFPNPDQIATKEFVKQAIDDAVKALQLSEKPVENVKPPIAETPKEDAVTEFTQKGVYSKTSAGLLFEWIPTELIDIAVTGKKIRIVAPETKKSFDGSTDCRRLVLGDLYDNYLSDEETKALFKEGLELPVGNYAFKILYIDSDAKKVNNLWDYIGNREDRLQLKRSAQAEIVYLSITDGSSRSQHFRQSWIPQYQYNNLSLKLPKDKIFGVTRFLERLPRETILNKVTHLQYVHDWQGNLSPSRLWRNMQAYKHDGSGIAQPEYVANNIPLSKDFVVLSETAENYGNLENNCPNCYHKAERIFNLYYKRLQQELGVKSPYETWLIADYFAPLYGGSVYTSFSGTTPKQLSEGLSTVSLARSRLYENKWSTSNYFSSNWYEYRNYLSHGYLGNILQLAGNPNVYERVYNWEKANLSISDRKKVAYLTNAQEGLGIDYTTVTGVWYKLPLEQGELLLQDGIAHSFTTIYTDTFYSLLLGNGTIIWESSVKLSDEPTDFRQSGFGGFAASKTRWKSNGRTDTYQPGVNNAPAINTNSIGQFPEKPQHGDQGAWLAAYDYSQIAHKATNLYYPDYELNGKQIIAKKGKLGAKVNALGVQNEGQDNIVLSQQNKLPIVIKGDGLIVYQNPQAGLTEKQLVVVEGKSFMVTGNRINLIEL